MRFVIIGPVTLRNERRWGWYVQKWRYFNKTSWRHGSAQIGPLRVVW